MMNQSIDESESGSWLHTHSDSYWQQGSATCNDNDVAVEKGWHEMRSERFEELSSAELFIIYLFIYLFIYADVMAEIERVANKIK